MITLQTKAIKVYPNPNPPAVARIDAHTADAAVGQTRFDRDTARRSGIIRSAQDARSVQIRRGFIRNMHGWLRAKLLEHPEKKSKTYVFFFRTKAAIHSQSL